ncbi:MAG: DUF2953 domain-containing protein [Clostridia bacterium]|nr:DUF2953 domain-containing protein [Clostridia bacterium]
MRWILLGIFLLLIAPVRIGVLLRWEHGKLTLTVGTMVWGVRVQTMIKASRDEAGALLLTASLGQRILILRPGGQNAGKGIKALGLMLKSNTDRAALRKMIQLQTLDIFVQIGGQNAAFTAMTTGFLQALNPMLPFAHIACRPSFNGETKALIRCIAGARLGILCLAWLRWRKRQRDSRKEETAWSIPSET